MMVTLIPYHNYEFTTYSKKSGILSRLRPVKIDHDGDEDDATDTPARFSRRNRLSGSAILLVIISILTLTTRLIMQVTTQSSARL